MYNLKKKINFFNKKLKAKVKEQNKNKLEEGCFVYELEADTTIPSEYILLMHFIGEIDIRLEEKIRNYLLSKQNKDGGWPLFHNGDSDISASVKAYFALKLSGLDQNHKQMKLARNLILKKGGAEESNVFTKVSLATFGQISWQSIPYMPIEIIKFPNWFPFNIYKISYWSRTVLVPLLIVMNKKPLANNPNGVDITELFISARNSISRKKPAKNSKYATIFLYLDKIMRIVFPLIFSQKFKKKCTEDIYKWILHRLNGEDGLGGIFPAMVNTLIALRIDETNRFGKEITVCKKSIDNLIVEKKKNSILSTLCLTYLGYRMDGPCFVRKG